MAPWRAIYWIVVGLFFWVGISQILWPMWTGDRKYFWFFRKKDKPEEKSAEDLASDAVGHSEQAVNEISQAESAAAEEVKHSKGVQDNIKKTKQKLTGKNAKKQNNKKA